MSEQNLSSKTEGHELLITRIFDAPRELVWKAWTEPESVKKWWGPRVFTTPSVKIDLRVGGEYLYGMRSPVGKDYWSKGTFREIVTPERLVLTDSFSDEKGHTVPASYYGLSSDFPLETLVTVLFEQYEGRKTKFILRYPGIPAKDFDNARTGWDESLDKLDEYLMLNNRTHIIVEPGKQEFFISREFNAPRDLVFQAFTDPKLYVQWLGPRRFKMTLEKFEPRNGGSWRYIHEDRDGNKYGFHGVFHELSPSLMIDTFEFEGLPEKGHVSLETARLEEISGGKTRLTVHSVFPSVADRDGMTQSGMAEGVRESYERLDELLEKMKQEAAVKMLKLNPYLRFAGNCRAAMEFYKACLGGELQIMTVGETTMASQMPPAVKNQVMHSRLEKDGMVIMASDNLGNEGLVKGNTVSLLITGKNKEDVAPIFEKLSEGGKNIQPLAVMFFGTYGSFTDKFGIDWMFEADNPKL